MIRIDRRQLQAVQGTLAGQSIPFVFLTLPIFAQRIGFAHKRRQQRIAAQSVVVVQVFVPQGDTEYSLRQQLFHCVFDVLRGSKIAETSGKALDYPPAAIDIAQQQTTAVGRDVATIEIGNNFPSPQLLKKYRL
jgi:hypothetical protein